MRDFTVSKYKDLVSVLTDSGYNFETYADYLKSKERPYLNNNILLRHDVDKLPENSLLFAKIQNEKGIRSTYYFRSVAESWNEDIILKISELGHEIGYHYENMDFCKGNLSLAWDDFRYNLDKFRKIVDIETICMHGSPMSKFDNKLIWEKFDYRSLGLIGEPYFDTDFDKYFYMTDTGRTWNGSGVSVRDKVISNNSRFNETVFKSTDEIINSINKNEFHDFVMFTFHPQRWHSKSIPWINEYILQNLKNIIKKILIKSMHNKKKLQL